MRRWDDSELALLDKVIDKEIPIYQVWKATNRSREAIRKRLEKRREERQDGRASS